MRLLDAGRGGPEENPFVPGQGNLPPHLAGRKLEQSALRGHLAKLARKRSPGTNAILCGPRGNGKTALLEWASRHARSLGIGVVSQSASVRAAEGSLRDGLSLLPAWMARGLGRFRNVRVPEFGMSESESGGLTAVLALKVRWRPLLVALDEAHKMDPGLGRDLLNAVQDLQREGRPVTLILAGTPDLPRHLNTMDASFWDRCEDLPIGRLRPQDSADAVRVPLEAAGRSITPEALDAVVRESCGYPFFLQLWGKALWDGCPNASEPISAGDVNRVRPAFQLRQRRFYGKRHEELKRSGLLPAAVAAAALFVSRGRRLPEDVEAAVDASLTALGRGGDEAAALKECEKLCDLGYIWPVYDGPVPAYEPGIPSLMRYVADAARARATAEDAWSRC